MGIKRLTIEEAEELIKVSEDYTDAPIYGFTLTESSDPAKAAEGWEDVTYYTSRAKTIQIPKGLTGCQYIYILTNTTMPGLVKIGYTKNKPSERVKQINSGTGVAVNFTVEWSFPCFNAHALEQEIHHYLQEQGLRVNNKKEFFNMSVEQAVSVVERIGEPYKMITDELS